MSGSKQAQVSKKSDKSTSSTGISKFPTPRHSYASEGKFLSELDSLKKEEQKLLFEKKRLLDVLDQLQLESDIITDKKSRLLMNMEKNILAKLENSESKSGHMLFSVVTWGSSWNDGLVFTVMAESEVWAKELVRQWLDSNGRKDHKIDKVLALVSRDVRGIVNVGAKLLDV